MVFMKRCCAVSRTCGMMSPKRLSMDHTYIPCGTFLCEALRESRAAFGLKLLSTTVKPSSETVSLDDCASAARTLTQSRMQRYSSLLFIYLINLSMHSAIFMATAMMAMMAPIMDVRSSPKTPQYMMQPIIQSTMNRALSICLILYMVLC